MRVSATRRYLISGRVQGVGYRYFAQRAAHELGLAGWVSNLADGRVEVQASGKVARLEEFEGRLRSGPLRSEVRSVEVVEAEADARIEGFHIR